MRAPNTLVVITIGLLLAAGCGPSRDRGSGGSARGGEGEGEGEGGEGEGEGGEGDRERDDEPPEPADVGELEACGVELLEGLPATARHTTTNGPNEFGGRCNKSLTDGGPDASWVWTAPEAGRYLFKTEGSDFDTVLSLRESACDGGMINCNDDVLRGEIRHSRLIADLRANESVVVTVDGWDVGDSGLVRLEVERVEASCEDGVDDDGDGATDCDDDECSSAPVCRGIECPGEAIGDFPYSGEGTTRRGGESLLTDATCGDGGGRGTEVTYRFTPPHAGTYLIETVGSSYDTILYVRDGSCTGPELACDDDGGGQRTSALRVDLHPDQPVVIVIDAFDGGAGTYKLSISGVESDCADGDDNDSDGLVDCDDADCLSADCALGGAWPDHWGVNEEEMLVEVNARRDRGATCGADANGPERNYPPAPELEMNEILRLSSRLHSLDMGRQDYFEHQGLDGRSPDNRMRDAGFQGAYPTGENIAAGNRTAAEAVQAFMDSPGHCRNIMNAEYRVVGFGYAYEPESSYGHYWTQNFAGSH